MKKDGKQLALWMIVLILSFTSFQPSTFAASNTSERASIFGEIDTESSTPTTVIVELDEESIVEAKHKGKNQSKQTLKTERNKVTNRITATIKQADIQQEYDYVFSGFSLELPASDIPSLLEIEGIKAVYPDVVYTTQSQGEGKVIDSDALSPNMVDSAPFIGSNKAWDAGYTGDGVTVAIIDTGVDYTHPDLAHAFGDYKGWDFVDNDSDPQETPVGDPRGGATVHGTHVAGTVAANGFIKGVAPDASLLAYRVLGPGGSGTTQNVIAGIERAVQDGADIMNLSLGNRLNSPDFATSIALDWAMSEGVVAVTSNGNSGPNNWTVGSPGTSREAISVGATRLPYNVFTTSLFTSEGISYDSAKVMGFNTEEALLHLNDDSYTYVYAGLGFADDFKGLDLEGKIALMSRGDIPFVEKATNAMNAGAVGAIIFNHVAGEVPDVPGMAIPTIKLTNEDGKKMLAELEQGHNTVSFDIEFSQQVGETVASFSSRGPAMDTWMIKPDVSAPGVNITSTVPTHNPDAPYGYAALQGTSMAAPHVAGAAAILLEAHPAWGVDAVKAALMNTAEVLFDENRNRYPHNTQGAGSIRIKEALETTTLVTPGSHSFGTFLKENGRQVKRQHITINNLSNEQKTYTFTVIFEGAPEGIKVMTSNNQLVQANKTQQVNLNVQVNASQLDPGYYEGSILINHGTQEIEVPTILFVNEPDYPRPE